MAVTWMFHRSPQAFLEFCNQEGMMIGAVAERSWILYSSGRFGASGFLKEA